MFSFNREHYDEKGEKVLLRNLVKRLLFTCLVSRSRSGQGKEHPIGRGHIRQRPKGNSVCVSIQFPLSWFRGSPKSPKDPKINHLFGFKIVF